MCLFAVVQARTLVKNPELVAAGLAALPMQDRHTVPQGSRSMPVSSFRRLDEMVRFALWLFTWEGHVASSFFEMRMQACDKQSRTRPETGSLHMYEHMYARYGSSPFKK